MAEMRDIQTLNWLLGHTGWPESMYSEYSVLYISHVAIHNDSVCSQLIK